MKASLENKLEKLVERFEEISGLLADPDVIAEQNRFRGLSKEYAELEPVIKGYREYRATAENLDTARALLDDSDPDMREMGAEEVSEGEQRLQALDDELQRLMLPKDPATAPASTWKSAPAPAATRRPCSPAICSACIRATRITWAGRWKW